MSASRMNVLLITSEDNGLQLSCYGDPHIQTPHLDRLADKGARFDNAYVTQAVCSPGRASILTGLYPHQNGQIGLATHRYSMFEAFPNIPTLLKQAGYRTGRIGKLHVLPEAAFEFDWVWNPKEQISFKHRDMAATAQAAGEFMQQGDEPFFLMANYADAHLPWIRQDGGLPEKPLEAEDVQVLPGMGIDTPRLRQQTADYYNCISRLDTGIGLLLDRLEQLGIADNTLVIYIADHGPQFSRGKCCSYELATRTPLLLHWPGQSQAGAVRSELVSQIDVLPTIMDAANVDCPAGLPGRSLRELAAGQAVPDWRDYIFTEWNSSHPYGLPCLFYPQRTVRDARYKLIANLLPDQPNPVAEYYASQTHVSSGAKAEEIAAAAPHVQQAYAIWANPPAFELYDLQEDPHEFHNLAGDPALHEVQSRLREALCQWQCDTHDALADRQKLICLFEEHDQVAALEGGHRHPDYRWRYLDYLRVG